MIRCKRNANNDIQKQQWAATIVAAIARWNKVKFCLRTCWLFVLGSKIRLMRHHSV